MQRWSASELCVSGYAVADSSLLCTLGDTYILLCINKGSDVCLLCFVPEAESLIDLAVAIMARLCNIETKPHYMQSCWAFPCTVCIYLLPALPRFISLRSLTLRL